jgi:hypothetical protein
VPPANKSLMRLGNGCVDTDNNLNDLPLADPNPRQFTSPATPCGSGAPTPTPTPTPTGSPSPTPTPTGSPSNNTNLRISQVYTRGGEAGATFQNDFVEVFNTSKSTIDINGWSLVFKTFEGSTEQSAGATFNSSFLVPPGTHLLVRLNGNGSNGQPVPGQLPVTNVSLGSTSGQIILLAPGQAVPTGCPIGTNSFVDLVGYGSTQCAEGSPAPVPPSNKSLMRLNNGCTDTDNNLSDFPLADPNPRQFTSPATPCDADPPSTFDLPPQTDTTEGAGKVTIKVKRTGDLTFAATVDYATSDGTANERSDYTTATGTLVFPVGVSEQSFDVLITDDAIAEQSETVTLTLSNATGNGTLGLSSGQIVIHDNDSSTSNNIETSDEFVDQHYHDFLNRPPDTSGWSFWINNIESCGGDAQCRLVKRIDTSAAFFFSIEFQNTGFLVYRLYKASLPPNGERPRGFPRYREFVRDTQQISRGLIVGNAGWEDQLDRNKVSFINAFVSRNEFLTNYPALLTPAEFVDKLNRQAGSVLTASQRDALVAGLTKGDETRATVLRKIAENQTFTNGEFRRAFVLMQYFGYLRRDPDDAGFDFWLDKLNQFNGDYRTAEMVKAFILSSEFRNRFGP